MTAGTNSNNSKEHTTRDVPYDLKAEVSVLGSLILDRDAVIKVAGSLKPSDFYLERHGYVYQAVLTLYERREPPDPVTLASELTRVGRLEDVGGYKGIVDLVNRTPTAVHIEHYARLVRRSATLRRLITAGGEIAAQGYSDVEDEAEALASAERILQGVAQSRGVRGYAPMSEMMLSWSERLDRLQNSPGTMVGIPSGYSDLDEITGGYQSGELIIFGARPGQGKTAILLDQALHMARMGVKVGIFSLEMNRDALIERMVSNEARVDSRKLRQGEYLSHEEWGRINHAQGFVGQLPILIDDTAGKSISELRAEAHRMKAAEGVNVLMVDYLQIVDNPRRDGNRAQEVNEVARKLKNLARDLEVPLLAGAQLNRDIDKRAGHMPIMSDIADSSGVEKEADLVALMHRPDQYERLSENAGVVKLRIAKYRNGPALDTVPLRFAAEFAHFQNLARGTAGRGVGWYDPDEE